MSDPDDLEPRLVWTEDGPRSGRFGDVYFSREDGLAESRAVFLDGCGLPDAWKGRTRFTVAELGFGSGLNICALLDLWRRARPPGARLHVFSVEAHPLTRDEAERALSAWPEIAAAARALTGAWPPRAAGFHRLDLPAFDATLDLAVGDVAWALAEWRGRADAWFLDGFAPAANPDMWSPQVLDLIAARSAHGARAATFTVAGAVRRGLADRGFSVEKRPGFGRKRERLVAWRSGAEPSVDPPPPATALVIGAGVAGAAVAWALGRAGVPVVLLEADRPAAGASGFPSALVTPRLDKGDAAIAALHAQALLRARAVYAALPDAVAGEGVLQLWRDDRDAARFQAVAGQPWLPRGAMRPVGPGEAGERLGEPVDAGGLDMALALTVRPPAVVAGLLGRTPVVEGVVEALEPTDGGWRARLADGTAHEAEAVAVAGGWGTAALLPRAPLRPVRGQADWAEAVDGPAAAWGGYAAPAGGRLLFGATHDREQTTIEPGEDDTRRNLATLRARLPALAARVEAAPGRGRRVAVRAVTPDRLPLAGAIAPGLFVLSGLGSRGFCLAPLLAEHLAAEIAGAPSPLPGLLAARVAPDRFTRGRD